MPYTTDTTAYEIADEFASDIKGKNGMRFGSRRATYRALLFDAVLITGTAVRGLGWVAADAIAKYANKIWISGSREPR